MENQLSTSLLKFQVLPEARTLANSVKGMLVKYCKAKEYHGPAPSARLKRQARDKLDKVFFKKEQEARMSSVGSSVHGEVPKSLGSQCVALQSTKAGPSGQ